MMQVTGGTHLHVPGLPAQPLAARCGFAHRPCPAEQIVEAAVAGRGRRPRHARSRERQRPCASVGHAGLAACRRLRAADDRSLHAAQAATAEQIGADAVQARTVAGPAADRVARHDDRRWRQLPRRRSHRFDLQRRPGRRTRSGDGWNRDRRLRKTLRRRGRIGAASKACMRSLTTQHRQPCIGGAWAAAVSRLTRLWRGCCRGLLRLQRFERLATLGRLKRVARLGCGNAGGERKSEGEQAADHGTWSVRQRNEFTRAVHCSTTAQAACSNAASQNGQRAGRARSRRDPPLCVRQAAAPPCPVKAAASRQCAPCARRSCDPMRRPLRRRCGSARLRRRDR
jgi:hypothetical protein